MLPHVRLLAFALSLAFVAHSSPVFRPRTGGLNPTLNSGPADMTSGTGGTYPRANTLSDGSIIGTYTGFGSGNNIIEVVHSTDGGSSWANIGSAASSPSASNDLDNPNIIQLPSGRLLLAMRNHDFVAGSNPRQYTYYRITITYSEDNGETWNYLSTPAQQTAIATNNGLWEPFMRIDANGGCQIYYSEEDAADDQNTMMQSSTDDGATWSAPTMVTGDGVTARDGMVGIAPFGDDLVMVFESVPPGGTFTVNAVTSSDDGATWSDRRNVYTPTGTNNNAGAPQIVNVGGSLVVSFMTDEDTQEHQWVTGAGAKVVTSSDGQNWGNKIEVFDPQANWPGMVPLDESNFLYMADSSGAKAQRISLC